MKSFVLVFLFFLLGITGSLGQSAIDISYEREILNYTNKWDSVHKVSREVNLDMHMLFNDSFALTYFSHKSNKQYFSEKQVGDKLIHHAFFYNSVTGEKLYEVNYPVKDKYLLIDSIEFRDWQFYQEEKTILGKSCHAALSVNNHNDSTIVWYTTDLNFQKGPIWYDGLPGVVMEVFDQKRNIHLRAKKITAKNTRLVAPQEGTRVSIIEFRKIKEAIRAKSAKEN